MNNSIVANSENIQAPLASEANIVATQWLDCHERHSVALGNVRLSTHQQSIRIQ